MNGSVYLFYGEEDFLIEEEFSKLKASLGISSDGFSSFEKLDGSSSSADAIVAAVMTPSMLGGKRMVLVSNFKALKPSKAEGDDLGDEKKDEANTDAIRDCIKNVPSGVALVFTYSGAVDKRRKLYKLIEEEGEAREFKPYTEWQQDKLLEWLVRRAGLLKKKLGSHAARLLIEISGSNLRPLVSELEKLAVYTGEKDAIEEADVRALASSGQINAFALSRAVREKNAAEALKSLRRLLKDREEPVRLIGLLASDIRSLLQIKSLEAERISPREMAKRLGAKSDYFINKCREHTHRFSVDELKRGIARLHEADLKLKTGMLEPGLLMEMLVTDLCGRGVS